MKKTTFLALFLACAWLSSAQQAEKYARVRIDLTRHSIAELAELGIETDHGTVLPGRFIETVASESDLQRVRTAGFTADVLIPDLQAWHRGQAAQLREGGCDNAPQVYETPVNYTPGTMAGYYRYQEMLDVLDDMATKFPHLISQRAPVSDTIVTHEGRPLWWVKVSDNPGTDEDEPEVLYTALHHAREPNSLSQLIFYLWYLLENYDNDPEIQYLVDNEEMYFIPCINPDGYLYNEATNPDGFGYWRKNRRDNGDGTFGVDLNRNYGYEWGYNNSGSSPNTQFDTYRGPGPFSEPETRMVRDFCLQHDFIFAFNYHTFSNLLIYPWGFSDELAEPALAQYAELFVRENHYHAGVASETVGYAVNGTSDDWMYGTTGAFAYTPEVGPGSFGFWPPYTAIDELNKDNMWQNLSMALSALRFGELQDISARSFPLGDFELPFELRRYGMQDAPFTVTLTPLTANVATVGPPQTFDLEQFELAESSFSVTLSPAALPGQKMDFLLTLDNGIYARTDTLHKAIESDAQVLFSDPCSDMDGWSTGSWGLTTTNFVSPPSSMNDSPNGDYFANDVSTLLSIETVQIPADAVNPQLRLWARWEIEPDYDFSTISAAGDDLQFKPLCGRYTRTGGDFQFPGAPIYDGYQTDWVEESLSLDAYIGQEISLEFATYSDANVHLDGFFFDDLRIEYFEPATSGTVTVPLHDFRLRQNQPNPGAGRTLIGWDNPAAYTGPAELLVFNTLGETVLRRNIDLSHQRSLTLDLSGWQNGVYAYQIRAAGWQSPALKMTVQGGR